MCIPLKWKCDGAEDCQHGEDEIACTTQAPTDPTEPTEPPDDAKIPCAKDEWRCASGKRKSMK